MPPSVKHRPTPRDHVGQASRLLSLVSGTTPALGRPGVRPARRIGKNGGRWPFGKIAGGTPALRAM